MATLENGRKQKEKLRKGDRDTFYIKFGDGRANFWAAPASSNEDMDIKMKIYEDGDLIETVSNEGKSNRNLLAEDVRVRAGREYKIKIYHEGGPSGEYSIKARGPEENKDEKLEIADMVFNGKPKVGKNIDLNVILKRRVDDNSTKYKAKLYIDGDYEDSEYIRFSRREDREYIAFSNIKFKESGRIKLEIKVYLDGELVCRDRMYQKVD